MKHKVVEDLTLQKLAEENEDVKKEFGGWFDLEGATAIPVHGVADAVWLGMENQHRVLQYSLSQKRITRVLNLPGFQAAQNEGLEALAYSIGSRAFLVGSQFDDKVYIYPFDALDGGHLATSTPNSIFGPDASVIDPGQAGGAASPLTGGKNKPWWSWGSDYKGDDGNIRLQQVWSPMEAFVSGSKFGDGKGGLDVVELLQKEVGGVKKVQKLAEDSVFSAANIYKKLDSAEVANQNDKRVSSKSLLGRQRGKDRHAFESGSHNKKHKVGISALATLDDLVFVNFDAGADNFVLCFREHVPVPGAEELGLADDDKKTKFEFVQALQFAVEDVEGISVTKKMSSTGVVIPGEFRFYFASDTNRALYYSDVTGFLM